MPISHIHLTAVPQHHQPTPVTKHHERHAKSNGDWKPKLQDQEKLRCERSIKSWVAANRERRQKWGVLGERATKVAGMRERKIIENLLSNVFLYNLSVALYRAYYVFTLSQWIRVIK